MSVTARTEHETQVGPRRHKLKVAGISQEVLLSWNRHHLFLWVISFFFLSRMYLKAWGGKAILGHEGKKHGQMLADLKLKGGYICDGFSAQLYSLWTTYLVLDFWGQNKTLFGWATVVMFWWWQLTDREVMVPLVCPPQCHIRQVYQMSQPICP